MLDHPVHGVGVAVGDVDGDVVGTDAFAVVDAWSPTNHCAITLGADRLQYDSDTQRYIAEGNIRYQDSSMRLTAEHAEGNQAADTLFYNWSIGKAATATLVHRLALDVGATVSEKLLVRRARQLYARSHQRSEKPCGGNSERLLALNETAIAITRGSSHTERGAA